MCLAIHKPKGKTVPEHYLKEGMESNKDGAGFCYFNGKEVITEKGFFTWKEFIKAYNKVKHFEMLIHFRWATHGSVCKENCHPFNAHNGSAVVHNGVLNMPTYGDNTDSQAFVDFVLTPLLKDGVNASNPALSILIEAFLGKSSKVAIMEKDGTVTIYNSKLGHHKKGVWYSNYSYEPYEAIVKSYNAGAFSGYNLPFSKMAKKPNITEIDNEEYDVYEYGKVKSDHKGNMTITEIKDNMAECWNCGEEFMLEVTQMLPELEEEEYICNDCYRNYVHTEH